VSDHGERQAPQRHKQKNDRPKVIGILIAGLLLVWFIAANSQEVSVTWWVFSTQTSLIVVIILSAILGAGITYFFTRVRRPHKADRDPADRDGADRRSR
jgi:uncharacterized integral membrane protein